MVNRGAIRGAPAEALQIDNPNTPVETVQQGWIRFRLTRLDLFLCLVLVFLALVARWPFIVRGNTLLNGDEAVVGIMAQDVAEGRRLPIFFYGQRYMGTLETFTMAALRLITDDVFLSLKLTPALYFSLLVGVTFCMITRWFGRLSGSVAALSLMAASPMFVQWSGAHRGWYVEVLLWGALLWWAYSEWFMRRQTAELPMTKQFLFGLLIGSGLWLNPVFVAFLLPVIVHVLLGRPLQYVRCRTRIGKLLGSLQKSLRGWPLVLPILAVTAVLFLNCIWAVWTDEEKIHTLIFLNLLPYIISLPLAGLSLAGLLYYLFVRKKLFTWLMGRVHSDKPIVLGMLIGYWPTMLYALQHIFSGQRLDDALPLGVRPIWTIGRPLRYLWAGLPVIFGADPSKYLKLVLTGRLPNFTDLPITLNRSLAALNWVVFFSLAIVILALLWLHRRELAQLFFVQSTTYSPVAFLILSVMIQIGLYVMCAPLYEFTCLRYMLPVWVMLPALLGASVSPAAGRLRLMSGLAVLTAMTCWSVGQAAFWLQLGGPHPLEPVAAALKNQKVPIAGADTQDAHVLSFLTGQKPPVFEYRSCWPRLGHYRAAIRANEPVAYVVNTDEREWGKLWERTGFPGPAPVDTQHFLYADLKLLEAKAPHRILERKKLSGRWELWLLDRPLPD